jgi:RNA polymerase sigma-70 factor (ECF subfamily)
MDLTYMAEDWRTCLQQLGPRLLIFARQWLPSVADAEDAVQEAFIRFWRKHRVFQMENQGLLFAAVRSAALDHLRRESRRLRREQAAFFDGGAALNMAAAGSLFEPSQSGLDPSQEQTRLLESAVRQLPPEQREVLALKIWGELTFAEIAVALGIPPNTAASRYRYALSALRKILQPASQL